VAEEAVMENDGARRSARGDEAREADPTEFCPSCGERGTWQKCKLICTNQRCSVRIILACVD
jgi:hypothetical protein